VTRVDSTNVQDSFTRCPYDDPMFMAECATRAIRSTGRICRLLVGASLASFTFACGGSADDSYGANDTNVHDEAGAPCPPVPASDFPEVKAWAAEVALGTEFGNLPKRVRRFLGDVTISMMEGDASRRSVLGDVVSTLTNVLSDSGTSLTLVEDGNRSARMLVWFTPHDDFDAIGAAEGFEVFPGNVGWAAVRVDAGLAITKVHVLVASDLPQREFTSLIHEEVTQGLGLPDDSARFRDSIFFETETDGGFAPTLSCIDRMLLKLLYTHLRPGDDLLALSRAMDRYFPHER
jgi:hypothetical protein